MVHIPPLPPQRYYCGVRTATSRDPSLKGSAERLVPELRCRYAEDLFLAIANIEVQMGEELLLWERIERIDT
jgi:hypothetical protein